MSGVTVKYRVSFGHRPRCVEVLLEQRAVASVAEPVPASHLARLLALAHKIDRCVRDGSVASYADAARRLGVTQPRVSQIAKLTLLSPDIQEAILSGSSVDLERPLIEIARRPMWRDQRRAVAELLGRLGGAAHGAWSLSTPGTGYTVTV
ncbi:MAG: hypothetical protein AAF628_37380 [Planctomycetota bacterium]